MILATLTSGLVLGASGASAASGRGGKSPAGGGSQPLWESIERGIGRLTGDLVTAASATASAAASATERELAPEPVVVDDAAQHEREQDAFQGLLAAALDYGLGMGEPPGSDPHRRRQAEDAELTRTIRRLEELIPGHPGGLFPIRRPAFEAVQAAERIAGITASLGNARNPDPELVEAELRIERARLRVAKAKFLKQLEEGQLPGRDLPAIDALLEAGRTADEAAGAQAKRPVDEIVVETKRWLAGRSLEAAWQRLVDEVLAQLPRDGQDRAVAVETIAAELLDRPGLPAELRRLIEDRLAEARADPAVTAPEPSSEGGQEAGGESASGKDRRETGDGTTEASAGESTRELPVGNGRQVTGEQAAPSPVPVPIPTPTAAPAPAPVPAAPAPAANGKERPAQSMDGLVEPAADVLVQGAGGIERGPAVPGILDPPAPKVTGDDTKAAPEQPAGQPREQDGLWPLEPAKPLADVPLVFEPPLVLPGSSGVPAPGTIWPGPPVRMPGAGQPPGIGLPLPGSTLGGFGGTIDDPLDLLDRNQPPTPDCPACLLGG